MLSNSTNVTFDTAVSKYSPERLKSSLTPDHPPSTEQCGMAVVHHICMVIGTAMGQGAMVPPPIHRAARPHASLCPCTCDALSGRCMHRHAHESQFIQHIPKVLATGGVHTGPDSRWPVHVPHVQLACVDELPDRTQGEGGGRSLWLV